VYACHKTLLNGDIASRDGSRFRGRGFLQLTGYVNYKTFQSKWNRYFAKDKPKNFICRSAECDANLDLLNTDYEIAMLAALIYWKDSGVNELVNP
jgi:predicted chitinase